MGILYRVLETPYPKENWPIFLPSPSSLAVLVGLHFADFRGIVDSDHFLHVPPKNWKSAGPPYSFPRQVKASGWVVLDLLETISRPSDSRRITVETVRGGVRTINVAEDWQEKLRQAMPFRFRNWNEVFDKIADQGPERNQTPPSRLQRLFRRLRK